MVADPSKEDGECMTRIRFLAYWFSFIAAGSLIVAVLLAYLAMIGN